MAPTAIEEVPVSQTTASSVQANVSAASGTSLPIELPIAPRGPVLKNDGADRTSSGGDTFFSTVLLENHHLENSKKSKLLDFAVVLALHVTLIAGPILAGLYFTDTLNLKAYTATLLVAPPPPPPPPPAPAIAVKAVAPKHVFTDQGKLLAPTVIPQRIAMIKEAPLEPDTFGVAGGVPGGVPGGQMGGVIGGILGGTSTTAVTPPPGTASKAPIRVGGKVKPPRSILTPAPRYPVIARQARVQGVVDIDAVIDTDGNISEMKVVSGSPLLISAALEAVKNWKYEPTYLNGQPIAVALIVHVTFVLNNQ